jgi:dTDP-4-amino-4,6-dideoxygalactose transaminase
VRAGLQLFEDASAWEALKRFDAATQQDANCAVAHLYYVLVEHGTRDGLIERLAEDGVRAVFHYVPLHSSPAGRRYGRAHGTLDVTDDVSERLVRLPLWIGMTPGDVERVAASVALALKKVAA